MTNGKPPPLIRYRQIKQYFGMEIPQRDLAKWEENNLIHPFRPDSSSRALYYTRELQMILEPNTICQPSRQTN